MGLGSGIRKKPIPDPGVKKAPDPGSGSATLHTTPTLCNEIFAWILSQISPEQSCPQWPPPFAANHKVKAF